MKKNIHPKYFPKARVICACGNTFAIGSTKELIETEICSKCHPFYTGKDKMVDTMGRIERFKKRLDKKQKGSSAKAVKDLKKIKRAKAQRGKPASAPTGLRRGKEK